ncbi:pyridoxamine 5'-phosphate oxidase family protein [Deinococcus sp.]|uniref:pyridoxamine 5'-phosphate oxidase family protein n=1 Tax=Deinococcus sp. TaxID=47478 RepID=UPI0025BF2CB7|nr:pyridoxamine 5'-phosphate oxidase family protein [Deinococcus sp.]
MSEQSSQQPTREEAVNIIAGFIKDIKFAMLSTVNDAGHIHARPMTTQQQEFDGDLWFLGAKDSEYAADLKSRPQVNVSYASAEKGEFVSITGTGELIDDRAKLDELWSDFYKAYYPEGKEDPNIQLIKVSAHGAEFWESEGKARSIFELAKGMLKHEQANMGQNGTVKL